MESLKTLKEKVDYFNKLVDSNIEKAKNRKTDDEKEEAVFYNLNIKLDGIEIIFYVEDDECVYTLTKKQIDENFKLGLEKKINSEEFMIYAKAVLKFQRLAEYSRREITFEELAGINTTPQVVKELLVQKNTITEQLKLLHSNRNIPEVQEYINNICKKAYCTEYVKYLINKYFYCKKDLVKPKKTGLECFGKLLLK